MKAKKSLDQNKTSKKKNPPNKMGKGLSSLFDKTDLSQISKPSLDHHELGRIQEIEVSKISPNPNQPRSYFDEEKLQELAESIKQVGIIEPIIVVADQDKYQLIAGERRWRATQKTGITTIPAVVKNDTPHQLLETMLIENIQREDLSPLEEAESYQLILNERNLTQEELGKRVGKSRTHITNLMRTLKLPDLAKKYLAQGELSLGQAKVLLSLEDRLTDSLIETVVEQQLTIREIEKIFKETPSNPKEKTSKTTALDANLKAMENKFRDKLKTKVTLHDLKNKVGKLEIEYYHYDDLNALLEKIQPF